jgi:hypothetical protein
MAVAMKTVSPPMEGRLVHAVCWAALCAISSGCGNRGGTVEGTVTYRGKALPSGSVIFFGEDNQVVTAAIREHGTFLTPQMDGGNFRVAVTTPPPPPESPVIVPPGPMPAGGAPERFQRPTVEIPKRYSDPDRSGLSLTVRNGAQVFNINLVDDE